jgi:hypothetical protein
VRGDERQYNLPRNPEVPTTVLGPAWRSAAATAAVIVGGALAAIAMLGRRSS